MNFAKAFNYFSRVYRFSLSAFLIGAFSTLTASLVRVCGLFKVAMLWAGNKNLRMYPLVYSFRVIVCVSVGLFCRSDKFFSSFVHLFKCCKICLHRYISEAGAFQRSAMSDITLISQP
jgi:hypothetical protein